MAVRAAQPGPGRPLSGAYGPAGRAAPGRPLVARAIRRVIDTNLCLAPSHESETV
jgi:hypothetical protein